MDGDAAASLDDAMESRRYAPDGPTYPRGYASPISAT